MSGHDVGIEMGNLLTPPQEDQHQEEGLTNGNTSESEQKEEERRDGVGNTSASEKKMWELSDFKKRECNTYIEDYSRDGQCQCGRLRDKHPTDIKTAEDTAKWTTELHSSEQPTDAFGEVKFEGESSNMDFLRLSSDTEPYLVYDLMTRKILDDGWEANHPTFVVSVMGGEGSAEVKPWVQKLITEELMKKGIWILTEGFDEGIGRCVGEAVRGHFPSVRAVGITPWGALHNKDHLVNPEGKSILDPALYTDENTTSDSCCLQKDMQYFLLVDDGSEGRKGGEKNFRVKFEKHISTQYIPYTQRISDSNSYNIPVLCMLESGEASVLERVELSLKNSTPWLVLAGSGGVADFLSAILENQSSASAGVDVVKVTELVKNHFPSEAQIDQLVEQVQSIYQNRNLITFYHEEERSEDFDTVMIKALMPASKHHASGNTFPYSKELILAMRWNKVDFVNSQLFNDDINWKDDALKDCMTFALLSEKQRFLRPFLEKKFDFGEYMTYGILEKLYSRVDEDSLVYKLLLECLKERLGTSLDHSCPLKEISLLEVSRVLKRFMGEEKPFYLLSGKKMAKALLREKEPRYRSHPCQSPWSDLFIWAILKNSDNMADVFWVMAEEPVLNALSAWKLLKEMSKLENKTDTKVSMENLAKTFEDKAHGMLRSCYQSNESHSFEVLKRKSPVWDTDCFQMGIAVESHSFFKHEELEATLSQAWWGDMKKDTTMWKVLLTFLFFPLCFTNLITFREPGERDEPDEAILLILSMLSKEPKLSFVVSRWRQFWSAPVTSFVGNAVMYFPFLFLFAYVLLVDFKPPPPSGPSIREYVLYFWVFTFLCEEIYEAFFMRDMTSLQRMKMYIQDVWNLHDLTAITLFIIGLICRMFEWSYDVGRCVLCIDYMVFTLRLIHISAVHKLMGPKIIIVGKMMKDVFSFIFFLGVWIVAYGVANQGLLYYFDSNPDRIFRRVFYRPYLLIFGDLKLEEIDVGLGLHWDMATNCTSNVTEIEGGAEPCRNNYWLSNWLVIILLVIFLLVTVILLINLLIAMLSHTFDNVQVESDLYWKFQHYNLIMEYQFRPVLAPPFIIINHLYLFFSFLKKKFHRKPPTNDNFDGLVARYRAIKYKQREKKRAKEIHAWENSHKKLFVVAQIETERSKDSKRFKKISDKVDNVLKQMTETFEQKSHQMTDRVDNVLKQMTETFEQKSQQMTDRVDRMEKQQQNQLNALETKMEKCSDALGQILDLLKKPPST